MDRESTRRLLSESAFSFGCRWAHLHRSRCSMPQFLAFLRPDLAPSSYQTELFCLRASFSCNHFLGLSGVLASVTQVHRWLVLFALSPVLYNLGIIAGTVYFYPLWGLPGIGAGVVIGSIAYLGDQHSGHHWSRCISCISGCRGFALMIPVVRDSIPRSLALEWVQLPHSFSPCLLRGLVRGSVCLYICRQSCSGPARPHRFFVCHRRISSTL